MKKINYFNNKKKLKAMKKKVCFISIVLMIISINVINAQSNDVYSLSTVNNTVFLDGGDGNIKSNETELISIHLKENKKYQLRISGSGTTFNFQGQSFIVLDDEIVDIDLYPNKDMNLLLSIKTTGRKEKYSWVLLYSIN